MYYLILKYKIIFHRVYTCLYINTHIVCCQNLYISTRSVGCQCFVY